MQNIFFAKNNNGEVVSIFDVDNGIKCGCRCIDCNDKLIAYQGTHNAWHFQHYSNKRCTISEETSLHRLAKECFMRLGSFKLPEVTYNFRGTCTIIGQSEEVEIEKVSVESASDKFRPDLVITATTGEVFFIEIAVTHKSTAKKIKYYRDNNFKCLEIILPKGSFDSCSGVDAMYEKLKEVFKSQDTEMIWLSHPRLNPYLTIIENKGVLVQNSSGLVKTYCPQKDEVVDVKDVCTNCKFKIALSRTDLRCYGNLSKKELTLVDKTVVFPPEKINYVGKCTKCKSDKTRLVQYDGLFKVCDDCNTKSPEPCPVCKGKLNLYVNRDSRFKSVGCSFIGCIDCDFTLTYKNPNGEFADEFTLVAGLEGLRDPLFGKIRLEELLRYRISRGKV